jgi:hypothetical protein
MSAFIDWFTLLFFSGCALIIWVVWIAMQTGWPAQPAANVARLAPGFIPSFGILSCVTAVLASLAWAGLVLWRVGKHRHALWKSVVLPAGGAALCWLLLMTLWLPLLDFGRSYKPWVSQIQSIMARTSSNAPTCLMAFGLDAGQMTAFRYHGGFEIKVLDGSSSPQHAICDWLLIDNDFRPGLSQVVKLNEWKRIQTVRRPSDNDEDVILFHRQRQP